MAKKMYIGDSSDIARKISKAYVGDSNNIARKIIKGYVGDSNNIAREFFRYYTPLNYLESTGTQYINTNVTSNQVEKVEIEAFSTFGLISSNKTYSSFLVGARVSTTDSNFSYSSGANNDFVGNGSTTLTIPKNTYGDLLTLSYSKAVYSIQCNNYSESGSLTMTINTPLNMFLFAANNNGIASCGTWKIVSCKFYDNSETLIRDFIPVLDQDGTPCLYDKVENKFYYNAGTGTFNYN